MRYITVPPDIGPVFKMTKEPMSFETFYFEQLVPQLPHKTVTQLNILGALNDAFDGVVSGDQVSLRKDEHEALETALAALNLQGRFIQQVLPWFVAVIDSPKERPSDWRAEETTDAPADEPTDEAPDKKPDSEAAE